MTISLATPSMIPALQQMWIACFGDDSSYTEFIFDRLIRPEDVLVCESEPGSPVAMLCLQRFSLVGGGEQASAAYIYGVATLPEWQGQGLSTQLLAETHRYLAGEGVALSALVPASEQLFQFYGKRGYETAFHINKARVTAAQIVADGEVLPLTPAGLGQMAAQRDAVFGGSEGYVRWDAAYLNFIGQECAMLGGEVLAVGDKGYAVCYPYEGDIIVKELAVPDEFVVPAVAAIHRRYGANAYLLYLRADTLTPWTNKVLPFAMIKWYDKKNWVQLADLSARAPYIAHVLD